MEEYYLLFSIVGVWMLLAVLQDMRTREIYNWLNFSLLGIALAYKAFLGFERGSSDVFLISVVGALAFYGVANLLYYGRAFAGGDAKLLVAVGAALPYESYWDIVTLGGPFVLLLFLVGALYSLVYSVFIVRRNYSRFTKDFVKRFRDYKKLKWAFFVLAFVFLVLSFSNLYYLFFFVLSLMPLLFVYLKAVESVMIGKRMPGELREGDWLEESVKVGKKTVDCSVHGLSLEDIALLKKAKKSVLIRDGIPFSPAFLIAWIVMVYVFSVLGLQNLEFLRLFSF